MLPILPCTARQKINRSWRQFDRTYLALRACSPLKSHPATSGERDARHDVEWRSVPVPPDTGARLVLSDKRLGEIIRGNSGNSRGLRANGFESFGQWQCWGQPIGFERVPPPELHDTTFGGHAVHLKLAEFERLDCRQQPRFVLAADEIWSAIETFRQFADWQSIQARCLSPQTPTPLQFGETPGQFPQAASVDNVGVSPATTAQTTTIRMRNSSAMVPIRLCMERTIRAVRL